MGEDGAKSKDWLRARGITCVLQTQFSSFFFTKEIDFFDSNCATFILQLNAENRINIRAVYNEIHVFKIFLYGIYMVATLSKF